MSPPDDAPPTRRPPNARTERVEAASDAFLVCAEDLTIPFTVRLLYDCSDPYAVRIEFPALHDGRGTTTWILARSLLEEGQRVESGEGDVTIVPCGPGYTGVELRGASGRALVLLTATTLRSFLGETYRRVPAGHEHRFFDLDDELTRISGGTR